MISLQHHIWPPSELIAEHEAESTAAQALARLRERIANLERELAQAHEAAGHASAPPEGLHTIALGEATLARAYHLYVEGALAEAQENNPSMPLAAALSALLAEAIEQRWEMANLEDGQLASGDFPRPTAIRARARALPDLRDADPLRAPRTHSPHGP
jgi:hypothetical protein